MTRFLQILFASALVLTLALPGHSFAQTLIVSPVIPDTIQPSYVNGQPTIGQEGKAIDAIVVVGADHITRNERVGFILTVTNKTNHEINLDASSITAWGNDKAPLHIYTKSELKASAEDDFQKTQRSLFQTSNGILNAQQVYSHKLALAELGMTPVTVEPGKDGSVYILTDIPTKTWMMISVKEDGDELNFVYHVYPSAN